MNFGKIEKSGVPKNDIENSKKLEASINILDNLLTGFSDLGVNQKIIYDKNPYKKYIYGLQLRLNIIRDFLRERKENENPRFNITTPIEKIDLDINTIIRDLEFDFRFLGLKVDKDSDFLKSSGSNIKADKDIISKLEKIKNGRTEHSNFKTFSELETRLSYLDPFVNKINEVVTSLKKDKKNTKNKELISKTDEKTSKSEQLVPVESKENEEKREQTLYQKINSIIQEMNKANLTGDVEVMQFVEKSLIEFLKNFKEKGQDSWDPKKIDELEEKSIESHNYPVFFLVPLRHKEISENLQVKNVDKISIKNPKSVLDFATQQILGKEKIGIGIIEEELAGRFLNNSINLPKKYPSISKEGLAIINKELEPHNPRNVQSYFNTTKTGDISVLADISETNFDGISILYKRAETDTNKHIAEKIRDLKKRFKQGDNELIKSDNEYYALAFTNEFFSRKYWD